MSKLLIEFYSGEIPPRFQKSASEKIKSLLDKYLNAELIKFNSCAYYSTHRIIIYLEKIDRILPDVVVEKKGPAVNSPSSNIENFARVNNVPLDRLQVKLVKNIEYYFLTEKKQNSDIKLLLSDILKKILEEFQWPKSMRWKNYQIRWIRPLHNILFMLDDETIEVSYGHLVSNNQTIIDYQKITCPNVDEYFNILSQNAIIVDPLERQRQITEDMKFLLADTADNFKEDLKLLEELAGITERPTMKMGKIDEKFMLLPPEVLDIVMKHHQKYFSVYDKDGKIKNRFLFLSTASKKADYQKIIENNEQVLRNRLKDAEFFYDVDRKKPIDKLIDSLKNLTYHHQLGNYQEKTDRLVKISQFLASKILPSQAEKIVEAAGKCKFDLVTNMVNELPELQAIMGYYYIINSGGSREVAEMVRDHYLPVNLGDDIPKNGAAIISIADKLDSIICMFLIGEKPTGSKDPYAVRRSAVGIIKILIENGYFLNLDELLGQIIRYYDIISSSLEKSSLLREIKEFFVERFIYLSKQDFDDHLIKSVIFGAEIFDIYATYKKLIILRSFFENNDKSLFECLKRIYNIAELSTSINENFDPSLLKEKAELELYQTFSDLEGNFIKSLETKDFALSLEILQKLNLPIKNFMDKVTIKSDDKIISNNRLNLITKIRQLTILLLDFSKF